MEHQLQKHITDVKHKALNVRKRLFKFRSGYFDLSNVFRSVKPVTLDNDVFCVKVESDFGRTMEEP